MATGASGNMQIPRVSIIMPTYNRAHLIDRAIDSVIGQTFRDWKLIIVDDCSRDSTRDRVASYKDPRIQYICQDRNLGVSAARNAGIRTAAESEYLAFIDDDDEWAPDKIQKQIALFENGETDLGVVGCGRVDHEGGQTETFLPRHRGWIFEDVLARRARGFSAPLLLVKRIPGAPDVLFDESFPCLEDAEYVLRISRHRRFDFVPEPLVRVYRDDGGPHVWNPKNSLEGYLLFLRKYEKEFEERPSVKSYYYYRVAYDLSSLGKFAEARGKLRDAMLLVEGVPKAILVIWYLGTFFGSFGRRLCSRIIPYQLPYPKNMSVVPN